MHQIGDKRFKVFRNQSALFQALIQKWSNYDERFHLRIMYFVWNNKHLMMNI